MINKSPETRTSTIVDLVPSTNLATKIPNSMKSVTSQYSSLSLYRPSCTFLGRVGMMTGGCLEPSQTVFGSIGYEIPCAIPLTIIIIPL